MQNSQYFCVFKYARTGKRSEARLKSESEGRARLARVRLTLYLSDFEKNKTTVLRSKTFTAVISPLFFLSAVSGSTRMSYTVICYYSLLFVRL